MTKIKIDGQDYDFDLLAEDSKAQLVSIQFIDQELAKTPSANCCASNRA